jgi:hypothetical protein
MVDQHTLGMYHVGDRDHRETQPVGFAGGRIGFLRAHRAKAPSQHIGAQDEVAVGIQRLARPHHYIPPSLLAGGWMRFGDELVTGQRMADQDRVGFVGVQHAIGLVGDRERAQRDAAVEVQFFVDAQFDAVTGQCECGFRHGGIARVEVMARQ